MAIYVSEEELRNEIYNIQLSTKLNKLLDMYKIEPNEDVLKDIEDLKSKGIIENYSRESFGNMILKISHKLAGSSNFIGYTWHEDFHSNALEKILSYALVNADLDMISKRSKEKVKIFAYITQICRNAFIEIINLRKQEQNDMMEFIIPFEDFYDHVKHYYNPVYDKIIENRESPDIRLNYILNSDLTYSITINSEVIRLFDTVYNVLKQYKEKYNKIEFIYPESYSISMDELSLIDTLDFEFLNLHKDTQAKYIPSFPKKEFKIKIDKFEDWE